MTSFAKLNSDDLDICSSSLLEMVVDNETGKTRLPGHAYDYPDRVRSLECFLERIMKEKEEREMIQEPLMGEGRLNRVVARDRPWQWQRFYLRSLPSYLRIARELPRELQYSEEIEVFLSCYDAHPVPENFELFFDFCKNPEKYYCLCINDYNYMRTFVNEFIKDLRQRLHEPSTRKKILERRRAADKNYREAAGYVRRLFDTCVEQVVLRIDLGYQKEVKASIVDVMKDIARFYANWRHNELFRHLHGYIMKIEYGMEKGIHVHLMLFYNASKRRKQSDSYFAQEIGKYWVNVVTKERGTYWNCNDNKQQYESRGLLGIGVIHAEKDKEKIENLLRIVKYLCKKEQFIKPKTNLKMKLIRKGKWPEQVYPKRGAPRASQRIARSLSAISEGIAVTASCSG